MTASPSTPAYGEETGPKDRRVATGDRLLDIVGLSKSFGTVRANRDISLHVERGEIVALLGENGAGKSTLVKQIFGLQTPDQGTIAIKGDAAPIKDPKDAIRRGIGMVHQHFQLVPVMTVAENMILGHETTRHGQLDLEGARQLVRELSEKHGLAVDPDAEIEDLPVGTQQRVEILKALSRKVDLLILDEPTAVLTPQETDELFEVMKRAGDRRHVDRLHHPQAARGARRRRPGLRPAPGVRRRRGRRGRHRRTRAGDDDGRP